MAANAAEMVALPPHVGRIKASLFCHVCKGDMIQGTCSCLHTFCSECVGCATCGTHDRHCSQHRRNIRKAS